LKATIYQGNQNQGIKTRIKTRIKTKNQNQGIKPKNHIDKAHPGITQKGTHKGRNISKP
jgi:hypothetical protein